jgi:hypothetical protein
MRNAPKVVLNVPFYGEIHVRPVSSGLRYSFVSLHIDVVAACLDSAIALCDDVVAGVREYQGSERF